MPRNPNTASRKWPRWAPWAGAGLLAANCALGAFILWGNDERPADNAFPIDNSPSASASQYPGIPAPSASAPNIVTPSATPSPSETSTTPAKPVDPNKAQRIAAAIQVADCRLDNFTNSGVVTTGSGKVKGVQINLDLSMTTNPNSDQARSGGQSKDLTWTSPKIVLFGMNPNSGPTGKRYDNAEGTIGGSTHLNSQVYLPTNVPAESTFAVVEETTATTPVAGGHHVTTVDTICGGMVEHSPTNVRPYTFDLPTNQIVTDTFVPN